MEIKGVGIGRGVAFGPVIRMAPPLEEPSDAPRAEAVSAESEIERVVKSLDVVNADLNRRAEEAANGDEGEWRTVELSAAVINLAAVAHDHGKVDGRCAFRMIRIDGYLLLMRFQGRLLSVL